MMAWMMATEKIVLLNIETGSMEEANRAVIHMNALKRMFRHVMRDCGVRIDDPSGYLTSAKDVSGYIFYSGEKFWEDFRDQCRWNREKGGLELAEYRPSELFMAALMEDHCMDCMYCMMKDGPSCMCQIKNCEMNDRVCSRFIRDENEEPDDESDDSEEYAESYYGRQNIRRKAFWEANGSPVYPPENIPLTKTRG